MININTLNKLDKLGMGSSIDKLENYVARIYYSEIMGNCIIADKTEREEIVKLLEQLKPTSNILKYDFDMVKESMSDKDIFLETYGVFNGVDIDNLDNIDYSGLEQSMQSDMEDLLGVVLADGIDIRIVYYNGILFQATTFNNGEKGKDITGHLRGIIPNNIDNISKKGITEIQGRITTADDIELEDKLERIVDYLIKDVDERVKEIFTVKVYKIYCEEIEFTALNKEIDFLEENEFDTADYLLVRNVPFNSINDAVESIYVNALETEDAVEVRICVNTNNAFQYPFENRDDILNINKKIIIDEIYESNIHNINWILKDYVYRPRLIIKPVKINSENAVRYIDIDNINILDKNELTIGSNIHFYLDYKNNIILCNKDGSRLF